MNVRTAVLYKKSFAQLLEESVGVRSYRVGTSIADCSIGPSFLPRGGTNLPDRDGTATEGTTADGVHGLWVLWQVSLQEMWCGVLRQELRERARRDTVRAAGSMTVFTCKNRLNRNFKKEGNPGIYRIELPKAASARDLLTVVNDSRDLTPLIFQRIQTSSSLCSSSHSLFALVTTQKLEPCCKMCPHANGDSTPNDPSQMVPVDLSNGTSHQASVQSNSNGHAATNGAASSYAEQQRRNPYAPRASDFLSNVSNFKIIESTLRGTY